MLSEEEQYDVLLPHIISGRFPILHHQQEICVIEAYRDAWYIIPYKDYQINLQQKRLPLSCDTTYTLTGKNTHVLLLVKENKKVMKYQKYECIEDITIGRGAGNTIVYDNPYISHCHAVLHCADHQMELSDCHSTNHVYVNKKRFTKGNLQFGDVITIMQLQIVVGYDFLAINIEKDIKIDTKKLLPYHYVQQKVSYEDACFTSFRMQQSYTPISMEIKAKSPPPIIDEIPLLLKLGPSFMMGIVSITNVLFMFNNNAQTSFRSLLPSIFMAISMFMGMVFFPLVLHFYQKRKKLKTIDKKDREYERYLNVIQNQINNEKAKERDSLRYQYPSIQTLWKEKTYWYLTPLDDAFLKIRFGIGNAHSEIQLHNESEYECSMILQDVPLVIDLRKTYVAALTGNDETMFYQLLMQLALTHSYKDVRIIFIGIQHRMIRWLPHMAYLGFRTYLDNKQDIQIFMETWKQHLEESKTLPFVMFIMEPYVEIMHEFMEYVARRPYMGISIITCSSLTHHYHQFVIDTENRIYYLKENSKKKKYQADEISNIKHIIRFLANAEVFRQQHEFPAVVSFLSLFNVRFVEELNIWFRWEQHNSYQTLKVPIGIQRNGQLLCLDLHEKSHGPHGIIAGMTGSGKSECMLTLLLALAIQYHPDDVSFVVIDYKGGGLTKLLEHLPHTAGVMTNLDQHLLQRTFIALDCEIKRRQELFQEAADAFQIANISICDYQRLYYDGKVNIPLSHLIIVCDEFAELKVQQPFYMDQMISIARIGRSLGIHLILATQKPSGIVNDQIWSNTNFHLCLKVAQKADSMDMLKQPDAAKLSQIGRFFLQIGNETTLQEGLSAWSQAEYLPQHTTAFDKIEVISNLGKVTHTISQRSLFSPAKATSQLEALLSYIQACADKNHSKAYPLWQPPLQASKPITLLLQQYPMISNKVLLGELDDPYKQCYRGFYLPLDVNSVVYGSQDIKWFIEILLRGSKHITQSIFYIWDITKDFVKLKQKLPQTYIQGHDEQDIHTFFQILKLRLEDQKVSQNKYSYVIIHGISILNEMLMTLKELENIMKEGMKYHMYFLLTANRDTDINYHIQAYISKRFILDMTTKEEYEALLQTRSFETYEYQNGRGFIKDDHLYEFRLAL